ncbi:MAG: glycosyltransferase family 2 protein [Holophagales bacterium]|nr:glycosyltransferase family 2 protein [Holophagales bacterium]
MSETPEEIRGRSPLLGAVVVHWRNEEHLERLLAAWPPATPLVVVDNSSTLGAGIAGQAARLVEPGGNLGFGAGADRGVEELVRCWPALEWVLVLNPDAVPLPGAIEALEAAIRDDSGSFADAAGLVPALEGAGGSSQCAWQLQPLPSATDLWLQTLFLGGSRGPRTPPPEGTPIGQPAAAALVLGLRELRSVGGFGDAYFPAWFEDVDLARRFADAGHVMRYVPAARVEHAMGGSVPSLGYGPFLWIYYRHLERYLSRHHAAPWRWAVRLTLPLALVLRLLVLPLRRPRRARSTAHAAAGLLGVLAGTLSGWRWPRAWARRFASPARPSGRELEAARGRMAEKSGAEGRP